MKTISLIVMAAAFGFAGAAYAEEGKPHRPHRKLPPEILEKFDKDGDGKLNKEERVAAKAARGEMRKGHMGKMRKEFDKDGDGKLSEEESAAMHEAHKKMMLEKFDKDGDGKLSEEEETAMKEERRKKMMERFDKDGDGELSDEEKAEMRNAKGDRHPGGPHGGKRKHRPGPGGPEGPGEPESEEAPGVTE